MIVEVFKTNVEDVDNARMLTNVIESAFAGYLVNFDLDDRDRILRVVSSSGEIAVSAVVDLLHAEGFHAEVLPDIIPEVLQF